MRMSVHHFILFWAKCTPFYNKSPPTAILEHKNDNNDKNKHGKEINLILVKNSNSNKIPKSTKMLIREISIRKSSELLLSKFLTF